MPNLATATRGMELLALRLSTVLLDLFVFPGRQYACEIEL